MARKTIVALAAAAMLTATAASAQTVKVGLILTASGPQASLGEMLDRGIKLYVKLHEKDLPPGVKLELIRRDDGGPNPDVAKRLATELITRDKVNFIGGVVWTPNGAAIAPLAGEAKVPLVLMNAAGSNITTMSPYVVRTSFTLWQSSYPLGQWAAKNGIKKAYTLVSDFGPGHDGEQGFIKGFTSNGGEVVGSVRMPVQNPDFVPFVQRVKDAKPDALYVFIPAGRQATAIMKAYGDLGLKEAGIKLIGPQDITTEEELANMGDVPVDVITAGCYSDVGDRPANKEFVAAWKKEYGDNPRPNFMSAGAWDGMHAIFDAIIAEKGKLDPAKTMEFLANWKNPNSPKGPVSIDPKTHDIIQNIYIRKVEKRNGILVNAEFDTIEAVKDPWKELNPGK